jgi:glucoamylase
MRRTSRTRFVALIPALFSWLAGSLALESPALGEPVEEPEVPAQVAAAPTGLPVAGLTGNQTSLRSVRPISPYEAEGAHYWQGSNVLQVADGRVHFTPVNSPWDVYRPADDPEAQEAAQADRAWLASGTVPGASEAERELATRALLDMRLLTRPGGANAAAWYTVWDFCWPRDASWVIAAFAATGHHAEALSVLKFLQKAQKNDGTWEARYHLIDATPVADGRRWQLDGNGWVPWATWFWYTSHPDPSDAGREELQAVWPMVRDAADYAASSLDEHGLPPASPDYWEISTDQPNIGTAAPLLAGLRSAADLARAMGEDPSASRWAKASVDLAEAIQTHFAPHGYPRTLGPASGADAAVTFNAPPFAPYDESVDAAVRSAEGKLVLPNGGVLPGENWPGNRSEAWTPETGFFALAAAASGERDRADRWIGWIADHRTEIGAIPEKVNAEGRPVSVAPLGWTDAIVLLALAGRDGSLPVPPSPAR